MDQLKQSCQKYVVWIAFLISPLAVVAQSTQTDTVCAGSQNVFYGVSSSSSGSTFNWFLTPSSAGTIDQSIAANDSAIQIDWTTTPGVYELSAVEINSHGCSGDTVSLSIVVEALPEVILAEGDSVCEGSPAQMVLELSGDGPWTIDYTDGANTYRETAVSSPHTIVLPAYSADTQIEITGLSDSRGCSAPGGGLPVIDITIFGKPVTGPIFHY